MSATLDSTLFSNFFNHAPVIRVPGRTFPVSNYYLEDLLDATNHIIEEGSQYAYRQYQQSEKTTLWVTSQGGEKHREVVDVASAIGSEISETYSGYSMPTRLSLERVDESILNYDLIEDVLQILLIHPERNSTLHAPDGADTTNGSILIFLPGIGEIRSLTDRLSANRTLGNKSKFSLIPLHSKLSSVDQRKAFLPVKAGCRKIILSTNIAETSVTIQDVIVGKFNISICFSLKWTVDLLCFGGTCSRCCAFVRLNVAIAGHLTGRRKIKYICIHTTVLLTITCS